MDMTIRKNSYKSTRSVNETENTTGFSPYRWNFASYTSNWMDLKKPKARWKF